MHGKSIKTAGIILLICVSGILYSCQSMPDGTEFTLTKKEDDTRGVSVDEQVDIRSEDNDKEENQTSGSENMDDEVRIYVCGAVKNPGVYTLTAGERIEAAVISAGGFTEDAAEFDVNLADFIQDGQKIYIPSEAETAVIGNSTESEKGLLDINRASASELMELPGIGEAKAGRIIDYRESNGRFQSIDDLKQVPGIKEGIFESLKDLICVG